MTRIYIRKLQHADHLTSYQWRNNPAVWEFTGTRPNIHITKQIEQEWIEKVLQDTTTRRYAICIKDTDEYVGNVHFTDIDGFSAQFHIFIGVTSFWGKGIGFQATKLLVEEGFASGLTEIYLFVSTQNHAAISIYKKCGFEITEESADKIKMTVRSAKATDPKK
jgi:RimJ/RimL family protein N-acetyltransferase